MTNHKKTPLNIVLCYPVEPHHLEWLQQTAPDANIINAGQEGIAQEIMNADIFLGHAKVPVDWDSVVKQGRLQWIQSSAAGLDHCLVPSVIESNIPVSSASGLFANQVAEQTFALLFGVLRSIPTFFRQMQSKEFIRRPTFDLHGKTVGIIGMGGNGRRLAQVLAPFRVKILATDYYPENAPPEVAELLPHTKLHEVAARSDILILTLPLNESTHHCIDGSVLDAMKRGSFLINVARGQVVDEQALIERLQSGHITAAGVDVTEVEPLPLSSPLWSLPNVLITPHVGAQAACRVDDTTRMICANLKRYLANEPLFNLVDKRLGFPHPSKLWRA